MRNIFKGAVLAAILAGASMTGLATAPAHAASGVSISTGSPGFAVSYREGTYRDRYGRLHRYRYPADYRRYHRPQSWYRHHRNWDRHDHRDWYRGR